MRLRPVACSLPMRLVRDVDLLTVAEGCLKGLVVLKRVVYLVVCGFDVFLIGIECVCV